MRIMFYRDKKASDVIQICTITKESGVKIEEPYRVETHWDLKFYTEKTNEFWRPLRIYQQD